MERVAWSIYKTCATAAALGATIGLIAGVSILLILELIAEGAMGYLVRVGVAPYWIGATTVIGAVIGAAYCRALIRRSPEQWFGPKQDAICCSSCLYDLSHNTSGVCPECG